MEEEVGVGANLDELMQSMQLTLTLEDGSDLNCQIIAVFTVDGIEDKEYMALYPTAEEDAQTFLYQFKETAEGEIELMNIEDDEEYDKVSDAFEALMEE